ncbi:MAG: hypothetical protein J0H17_20060 [Rhizobiales bacterium]|nr:hypothetical protein [Hyphomicrobiales bacterium]
MPQIARLTFSTTLALVSVSLAAGVHAEEDADGPQPDKGGYSLFKPVPDDKLREFSADRPGKSHSSTTVDGVVSSWNRTS